MIAAYGDPGLMLCLTMIPALAHGWAPRPWLLAGTPRTEVTRTVMLPFPASGRCAKKNVSVTAPPPGPVGGTCPGPGVPLLPSGPISDAPPVSSAAPIIAMTHPRTVLNFVHSDRRSCAKPSRPGR
jgi:hypothetical protein